MICKKNHKVNFKVDKLPESQAGAGRHKCAICAYESGYEDGVSEGIEYAKKHFLKMVKSLKK